ncbi:cupin domain-containing protein [Rhodobacteraceae bacterium B1Z28]|uniref:Cupin domain-containing protein n=1 Tax=Ruegeria haliotis TaxID=2747601 RepID=A0ABX2PKT7_9RHOB|nr:cupin domain-containing protein [Ruegeria haliotis]NVO54331.1 cupin domain-containing protein [Ruegeria haliotis]
MTEPAPGQRWHIPDVVKRTDVLETLIGTYEARNDTPSTSSLSFHIYRLAEGQIDDQTPHREDELYYVFSGMRTLVTDCSVEGKKRVDLVQGDLVYVPAHAKHVFEGSAEIVLLVFFAPNFSGD